MFDLPTWLEAEAGSSPQIAAITIADLWHGVKRATEAYKARRQAYLQLIVESLTVFPYTETTALEHARIGALLETSGKMIWLA